MVSRFIERTYKLLLEYHRLIFAGLWLVMLLGLGLGIWRDFESYVEPLMVRAYVSEASPSTNETAADKLDPTPTTLTIDARVTLATHAVEGATLDAILHGKNGSQGSVLLNPTDEIGNSTTIVPASLGDDTVSRIDVRAHAEPDKLDEVHLAMVPQLESTEQNADVLRASTSFLVVNGSSRAAPTSPKTKWWLPAGIGTVFITTLMFAPWMSLSFVRVLTVVHCSVMLGAFTYGYKFVVGTIVPGQILQLSFGYVCWGTYSTDLDPTWTFVLGTSEPSSATGASVLLPSTIGAPLWVMLLSVLGSVLLVVSLLIELNTKVHGSAESETQANIRLLTRHQFYILFSPVGAVFVYTALAEFELLERNLFVAAMSLVAGTTINLILDLGINRVQALFSRSDPANNKPDGNTDQLKTERKPEVESGTVSRMQASPPEPLASRDPDGSQGGPDSSVQSSPSESPPQTIENRDHVATDGVVVRDFSRG